MVLRSQFPGAVCLGQGLLPLTQLAVQQGQVLVAVEIVGRPLRHDQVLLHGLLQLPLLGVNVAQSGVCLEDVGPQFQGLAIGLNSLVPLLLIHVQVPQEEVSLLVFAIQAERGLILLQRLLRVAFEDVDQSPFIPQLGIMGTQ